METLLREALVRKTSHDSSTEHNRLLDTASIPVSVYEGNAGRRDAMDRLLDYAEAMTVPHEPFIYLFQMEKMVQRASVTEAGTEIYLWISAEPH